MKNLFKPKESSSKGPVFTLLSSFDTSREGGDRRPQQPAGALGSPVKSSPNLFSINSNFNTRADFTITFA